MTVNSKEENSKDFCLDFVQEFGLRMAVNMSEGGASYKEGGRENKVQ